jgi:uncharacterized membrane protein YhhN
MKKGILPLLFFLILILEIISGEFSFSLGVFAFKPLLMPILGLILYKSGSINKNKILLLALFFSWLGDIILMFSNKNLFVFGLGSFLITHLIYIFIFVKKAKTPNFHSLGLILIPLAFYFLIYQHVPLDFKIPVMLYFLVITTMVTVVSFRNLQEKGNKAIFLGAILFVISDAILAYNKFVVDLPFSTFLVMSTYGLGQYFIVKGWIKNNGNSKM